MNKKRTLIILSLICVGVYSVFFTLFFINNSSADIDDGYISSLFHSEEQDHIYSTLTSITTSDIDSFNFVSEGKEYNYIKGESGWVCTDSSAVTDAVSVSYALNTLADIKIYQGENIKTLDYSEENSKKCGLDDGFSITLKFKDGTAVTYTVGDYLKFGSAYYFSNGDGKIYTVLNRFTSAFQSLIG